MKFTSEQLANHPNLAKLAGISVHKNENNHNAGWLCPQPKKPAKRVSLVGSGPAKKAGWHIPGTRLEITFTVYSNRPADYDGYDIKALQDFLVKAGIIEDDRWDILAGRIVSRKAATQGEEKTVVEISEA